MKVVVGLGKTGLSCVRYLIERGEQVAVVDTRPEPPGLSELRAVYPNVIVKLNGFNESVMNAASELIVSPGVSLHEPAIAAQIARGVPAIGDVELFLRHINAPVIAITGSNGKSTVTTLVGEMAKQDGKRVKVGGNLGTPVLDLITPNEPDFYVLELSSFQLETIFSLQARCAVNLNISEDHMDRYDSLNDYIKAKLRIYKNCQNAVVNLDDPVSYHGASLDGEIGFSIEDHSDASFSLKERDGKTFFACGDELLFDTSVLYLRGKHQYANVLAALAMGSVCGFSRNAMMTAAAEFKGLPHRCQLVTEHRGIAWYNDSKATNVGAAVAAIKGIGHDLNGKVVLLAGGQGKEADFSGLREVAGNYVRSAILFGEDRDLLANVLNDVTHVVFVKNLDEAVWKAKSLAKQGDAVLLAPACASFDMFKNFEHRGECFVAAIKEIL